MLEEISEIECKEPINQTNVTAVGHDLCKGAEFNNQYLSSSSSTSKMQQTQEKINTVKSKFSILSNVNGVSGEGCHFVEAANDMPSPSNADRSEEENHHGEEHNGISTSATNSEKRLRNLKKLLRATENLESKIKCGEITQPSKEQEDKVARKEGVKELISKLEKL